MAAIAGLNPGAPPPSIIAPDVNDTYRTYDLFDCIPIALKIDLYYSIKERVTDAQQMEALRTNEVAIAILKDVKFEANVRAFFTKTVILLLIGVLALGIVAFGLPQLALALGLIGIFVVDITLVLLGATVGAFGGLYFTSILFDACSSNPRMPAISNAYDDVATLAQRYIDELERNPNFHIQLAGEIIPEIPQ